MAVALMLAELLVVMLAVLLAVMLAELLAVMLVELLVVMLAAEPVSPLRNLRAMTKWGQRVFQIQMIPPREIRLTIPLSSSKSGNSSAWWI